MLPNLLHKTTQFRSAVIGTSLDLHGMQKDLPFRRITMV